MPALQGFPPGSTVHYLVQQPSITGGRQEQEVMQEREARRRAEQELGLEKGARRKKEQELKQEKEARRRETEELVQELVLEKEARRKGEQELIRERESRRRAEKDLLKESESRRRGEEDSSKEKEKRKQLERHLETEKEERRKEVNLEKEAKLEVEEKLHQEKNGKKKLHLKLFEERTLLRNKAGIELEAEKERRRSAETKVNQYKEGKKRLELKLQEDRSIRSKVEKAMESEKEKRKELETKLAIENNKRMRAEAEYARKKVELDALKAVETKLNLLENLDDSGVETKEEASVSSPNYSLLPENCSPSSSEADRPAAEPNKSRFKFSHRAPGSAPAPPCFLLATGLSGAPQVYPTGAPHVFPTGVPPLFHNGAPKLYPAGARAAAPCSATAEAPLLLQAGAGRPLACQSGASLLYPAGASQPCPVAAEVSLLNLAGAGPALPCPAGAGAALPCQSGAGPTLSYPAGAGATLHCHAGAGASLPCPAGAGASLPWPAGAGATLPCPAGAGAALPCPAGAGATLSCPAGPGVALLCPAGSTSSKFTATVPWPRPRPQGPPGPSMDSSLETVLHFASQCPTEVSEDDINAEDELLEEEPNKHDDKPAKKRPQKPKKKKDSKVKAVPLEGPYELDEVKLERDHKDSPEHVQVIKNIPRLGFEIFNPVDKRIPASKNLKFLNLLFNSQDAEETLAAYQLTREGYELKYGEKFVPVDAQPTHGATGGRGKDTVQSGIKNVKSEVWVCSITTVFNMFIDFVQDKQEFRFVNWFIATAAEIDVIFGHFLVWLAPQEGGSSLGGTRYTTKTLKQIKTKMQNMLKHLLKRSDLDINSPSFCFTQNMYSMKRNKTAEEPMEGLEGDRERKAFEEEDKVKLDLWRTQPFDQVC